MSGKPARSKLSATSAPSRGQTYEYVSRANCMMSLSLAATIAPPLSICVRTTSKLRRNKSTTFGGKLPKLMLVPASHSRQ